jgi:acylglycerol lipase
MSDLNAPGLDSLVSVTGHALQTYRWMPGGLTPIGVVFFVFGVHDHCGRYDEFASMFVVRGFACHAFDWVGMGRSAGDRGVWNDAALNIVDLHRFICDTLSLAMYADTGLPYFVVAKAAGVILANGCIDRLMRDNFARKPAGFCCISPAGKIRETYSATRKAVARFVASVAPGMGVASIKVDLMNSVPSELAAYKADPLVLHSKISASLASSMLKVMRDTDYSRITCPVLVLAAELEGVVDADAGVVLYESVPAASKVIKTYAKAYHDLVREPCKELVFSDIGEWLLAVMRTAATPPGRIVAVCDLPVDGGKMTAEVPDHLIACATLLAALRDPHLAPWSCAANECKMAFADEDALLLHVRTAHQLAAPFRCFACAKEFGSADDVTVHESSKHSDAASGLRASTAHEIARSSARRKSEVLPVLENANMRRGSRGGAQVPPINTVPMPTMATMPIPSSPLRLSPRVEEDDDRRRRSDDHTSSTSSVSSTPPKPSRLSPRSDSRPYQPLPGPSSAPTQSMRSPSSPAVPPARLQHSASLPASRMRAAASEAPKASLTALPPPPPPPAVAPLASALPSPPGVGRNPASPPPIVSPPNLVRSPSFSASPAVVPRTFSPPPVASGPMAMQVPARSVSPPPTLSGAFNANKLPPPPKPAMPRTAARKPVTDVEMPDFPDVPALPVVGMPPAAAATEMTYVDLPGEDVQTKPMASATASFSAPMLVRRSAVQQSET